jgi:nitrite reductase/ring-hydroxylating ferredoxin subunit
MGVTTVTHRLGPADEVPIGEGRAYPLGDTSVAVFRLRNGKLCAVSAVCPHAGGPIADGQTDDRVVVCPLHLHAYDLTTGLGTTGQPALRVYPIHTDDAGYLVVEVPAGLRPGAR